MEEQPAPQSSPSPADAVSVLLDELVACERDAAAVQARSLQVLARLHEAFGVQAAGVAFRSPDQLQHRSMRLEIASALRVGERTVDARLDLAFRLTCRLPATMAALSEGRITDRHARILAAELTGADDVTRAELEARLLPFAEVLNPARFTRLVVEARERANPDTKISRHERAMRDRAVWVSQGRDGMSTLQLHTDAVQVAAIFDRVTRAAGFVLDEAPAEEDRTLTQVRADLTAKVLLGTELLRTRAGRIVPTVTLTVPVLSLLGASDDPATLDGCTPIDRVTAARLVGNATSFTRILTDPVTDVALAFDPHRYRITGAHRQFLQARWGRCGMVGCGMPADRCDMDHLHEWAHHGRSTPTNLWPLCQGHHTVKTFTGWEPTVTPDGGVVWTSPVGRHYPVGPRQRTGPPGRITQPVDPPTAADPGELDSVDPCPPPPWDDTDLARFEADAAEVATDHEHATARAAATLRAIDVGDPHAEEPARARSRPHAA